uniref:Uncharacterized protein n=1 Tax=Ditylenchus dipsaci TaxID=166011 RepID=A0A915DAJ2_9BILA
MPNEKVLMLLLLSMVKMLVRIKIRSHRGRFYPPYRARVLAFKNDVQFWRERKSLEGLSVRSVLFNVFQSVIVFLYICDNDSSWVIKLSVAFGLLIELWKIPKVLNVQVSREKKCRQLQKNMMSWPLNICLGCCFRSWQPMRVILWSTKSSAMMTPQLFINYKLKSVAHLPWRMLTYKFVNTFIDDLFAFIIKMPTMYRIGCFRDDIVFLRWAYRVDPVRINGKIRCFLGGPNGALLVDELDHASVTSLKTKCQIQIFEYPRLQKALVRRTMMGAVMMNLRKTNDSPALKYLSKSRDPSAIIAFLQHRLDLVSLLINELPFTKCQPKNNSKSKSGSKKH